MMDAVECMKAVTRMLKSGTIDCAIQKYISAQKKNDYGGMVEAAEQWAAEIASYHATEIDKFAIQTTQANFPDVVQLGDAFQVREDGWTYAGLTGGASEAVE